MSFFSWKKYFISLLILLLNHWLIYTVRVYHSLHILLVFSQCFSESKYLENGADHFKGGGGGGGGGKRMKINNLAFSWNASLGQLIGPKVVVFKIWTPPSKCCMPVTYDLFLWTVHSCNQSERGTHSLHPHQNDARKFFLESNWLYARVKRFLKQDALCGHISDELIPFSDLKPHLNKCL